VAFQTACYLATWLIAAVLGHFVSTAAWQAGVYWDVELPGRPVPAATEFLFQHYALCAHLFFYPWLGLVGLPLFLPNRCRDYWNTEDFFLRLVTFATVEVALLLALCGILLLPALGIVKAMPPDPGPLDTLEHVLFWAVNVAVVTAGAIRLVKYRRTRRLLSDRVLS
jgi:hypothetical protein